MSDPQPGTTKGFTVRLELGPHKLRIVTVPSGLPCYVSWVPRRHDNGRRLMPGYVCVQLTGPMVEGKRTFYTSDRNVHIPPPSQLGLIPPS